MSPPTLESLPAEILLEIFTSFDNFSDPHLLNASSAVCYRLFNTYGDSILAQIAKNITGPDSWEAATTVLLYQRKDNSEALGSHQDHAVKNFELHKEDILNLVANQKLFKAVSQEFLEFDSNDWPDDSDWKETWFVDGDALPIDFFYKTWLLSIQFACDTIETFARRPTPSRQQLADICLLTKVVLGGLKRRHCLLKPIWSGKKYKLTWFGDYWPQRYEGEDLNPANRLLNTLLFWKMTNHLSDAYEDDEEYETAWFEFCDDYGDEKVATEAIMKKYNFCHCWDKKLEVIDDSEPSGARATLVMDASEP